ncbi:MAG: hypothetical protein JWM42_3923 [Burkholderia sp.]|nr:hypothetical protein [Burkholderia sp.]
MPKARFGPRAGSDVGQIGYTLADQGYVGSLAQVKHGCDIVQREYGGLGQYVRLALALERLEARVKRAALVMSRVAPGSGRSTPCDSALVLLTVLTTLPLFTPHSTPRSVSLLRSIAELD